MVSIWAYDVFYEELKFLVIIKNENQKKLKFSNNSSKN